MADYSKGQIAQLIVKNFLAIIIIGIYVFLGLFEMYTEVIVPTWFRTDVRYASIIAFFVFYSSEMLKIAKNLPYKINVTKKEIPKEENKEKTQNETS